jgi:hypothetical protein
MNPLLALTILGLFLFALAGALSFAQPPRQLTPEQQAQLQAQQELSGQSEKNIAFNENSHS